MTHIMLDLETWGKRPGCDIRSIGAVVFDPVRGDVSIPCTGTCKGGTTRGNVNDGGDCSDCMNTRMERGYGDTFYIATDNPVTPDAYYPNRCHGYKYPLHRDPETVKWWSEQSDDAQAAFDNPVDLRIALIRFGDWLESVLPNCLKGVSSTAIDLKLWANDPHFDVSILAEAYHAVGLPVPWHYRAPRSMRTVVDLSGLTRDEYVTHGTAHNALDDAIAQALTVCKCYERLGLTRDS